MPHEARRLCVHTFVQPVLPPYICTSQRGSGTILVVEDEDAVRTFIDRALRNAGFSVVTAVDGRDALQRIAESDDAVDGMMLDLTMPNMGGLEVLGRKD